MKRLAVKRETIRLLNAVDLKRASGAAITSEDKCKAAIASTTLAACTTI